jgi:protein-S-isoprenylcysteine O-methyltransferase Ste14
VQVDPVRAVTDPSVLVRSLWLAWLMSWWAAAFWSNRTVGRPALGQQLLFRAFAIAGAVLLFGLNTSGRGGGSVLWKPGLVAAAPFVVATIAGFAFTWWARLTIGKLWSSGVTRKAEHRVVDTGPYGLVRHPIYTGLIFSAFATAFVPLTPMTLVGAALISFGFFLKARLEEQFLRGELGADAYAAYARRVPMLVPWVK